MIHCGRDAAALEAAYAELIDEYPEQFEPMVRRLGSLDMVRKSMHILIRREQEGDRTATPLLDEFEAALRQTEAMQHAS